MYITLAHIDYHSFTTCPEPHHIRRRQHGTRVARPQLPVAVEAPAVDAAARQQGTRVAQSRGDGDGSLGRRQQVSQCAYVCVCVRARV